MNNEEMITSMNEGVTTNSKGGIIAKVAIGAVVAAGALAGAIFLKKRRSNNAEVDEAVVVTESEKEEK
jgi:hypothetical protein